MKRFAALALFVALPAFADDAAPAAMKVLEGAMPPAAAPMPATRDYRLVTDYTMLGPQGAEAGTHVVTGDFTIAGDDLRWTSVTTGAAKQQGATPTEVEHRGFMEGFHYSREQQKSITREFFKDFPPMAHDERNLVWDERMFHGFVEHLDHMKINDTITMAAMPVSLAGSGTFNNRRIQLTLVGVGRRNGEDCFLMHYEALLNSFSMQAGPMTIAARSDYLGDIWVSIRTRAIEYGTLFEEVAGTIANSQAGNAPQPLHVIRVATLQRLR